MDYFTKQSI